VACLNDSTVASLIAGDIDDAARADVERHIDGCSACRELFAETARARAVSALATPGPRSEMPALERGRALGRYILLDTIGAGGMGVVYAAYDPELDRRVALKLLRPDAMIDAKDGAARLVREAQVLARLSNPHVIAVHDVGRVGEQLFVAMELIDGWTLRSWRKERSPTQREILDVFIQAGRGLAAAHEAGIVHRDFKPDNVLISRAGRVCVTDFGLARAKLAPAPATAEAIASPGAPSETSLTQSGIFVGTPGYAAPEQLGGAEVDERADQFSFCVTLYEALYGERPFASERGDVRPPPASAAVPGPLRRVLLRGLAVEAHQRHASMTALLSELSALTRPRRRAYAAAAAITAVLIAAVASAAFSRRHGDLCQGADLKLVGIWDGARKDAGRRAFAAAGLPYADAAWRSAAHELDGYAARWTAMETEACRATRIEGLQSDAMLALRTACLDEHLKELKALVELYGKADRNVIQRAAYSARALPPLEPCQDGAALSTKLPSPTQPEQRARVFEVEDLIARVNALNNSGNSSQALPAALAGQKEARDLAYAPLEARLGLALAQAQVLSGDAAAGLKSAFEAAAAAQSGRDDETAARAWLVAAFASGDALGKLDDAHQWLAQARSSIARLGGSADLEALLAYYRCEIASFGKAGDEMIAPCRDALDKAERLYGPRDIQVAKVHNLLAIAYETDALLDTARQHYETALSIEREQLGDKHPIVGSTLANEGALLAREGRQEEAIAISRRALEIFEVSLGPDNARTLGLRANVAAFLYQQKRYPEAMAEYDGVAHRAEGGGRNTAPMLARALLGKASCYREMGEPAQSVPEFERALALAAGLDIKEDKARICFGLARGLWDSHQSRPRALAFARQGRGYWAEQNVPSEVAEIDEWIAHHSLQKP
jgi:Tfp pilus assembly protein PilF